MLSFAFITVMQADAADMMIPCAPQAMNKKQWWSWRLIDGRKCWYPGKAMLPRNQLHWVATSRHLAEPSVGQPDGRLAAPVAVAPFEQAWRNLWIDLYVSPWLEDRNPVTEWRIYK
jgi:hypothetical protein